MAHELTFNQNGVANIFSVRETPWHKEGVILRDAPTLDEAMALAGHMYDVDVRPTYILNAAGEYVPSMGRSTVRTDTGAELGSVGGKYTPLQNAEAFGTLAPLLDTGVASLETGGTLRNGADAWMQIRFNTDQFGPVVKEIFADEVVPFGLIANNHAGRRGVLFQITPIRVVCANTLGMSESRAGISGREGTADDGRAIMIRHTASVGVRAVEAAERLFRGIVERYEVVATQYRALKQTRLDLQQFVELVSDVVAPDPRDNPRWNPESRAAESVIGRAEAKRARLEQLWTGGTGHTGDHSAWEAYNAATEALDHDTDLWPTRAGVYRTQSLMFGEYGRLKAEVLKGLVEVAAE